MRFKAGQYIGHAFVYFHFLKSKLKAHLNIEIDQVDDPLNKSRDVKYVGHHYSSGKTEVIIKEKSEIPYQTNLLNHLQIWIEVLDD